MKITVDTNMLVRVAVNDDASQAKSARKVMDDASLLALPATTLCELVWVLRSYGLGRAELESILVKVLQADNVTTDWEMVAEGLDALRAGADFADGVIAFQGRMLRGETFVSFDRRAVRVLQKAGKSAVLLV